jgi:3-deoxy-D-manno-octulosonate 8-phosphate phosphatase KdsC-like HAD superfamily phosphatase
MAEERPAADWHLDRRLQITHILSTLSLGVGAVLYVGDIRKDVEVLKAKEVAQAARDQRQDLDAASRQQDLQSRLERIDEKLDRLIENRSRR